MANYNIKQEAKVYLVHGGYRYTLEVGPELSFSQTFTDKTNSVRTLHDQNNFFDRSNIKKANPANFSFQVFFYKDNYAQSSTKIVHDRLLDCESFDLYISTEQDVFKLEKCVIANGTYGIERSKPLSLKVSGSASKLSKVGAFSSYSFPGSAVSVNPNLQYLQTGQVTLTLGTGNTDISSEVLALKVELQNSIKWTPNMTVDAGIAVTGSSNAVFPQSYIVSKKSLAGNISRYLCDSNSAQLQTFDTSTPLRVRVGEVIGSTFYGLDFNMPTCSFTNRTTVSDLFLQNYDWRNTSNQAITTTITYNK